MNGNRERSPWERFWHDVGTIAPILLVIMLIFVPFRFFHDWVHGEARSLLSYLLLLGILSLLPISLYGVAAGMRWWFSRGAGRKP